ncbi:MAG: hypothetical protein V3T53_08280 [Phycisphaerales bacterium]
MPGIFVIVIGAYFVWMVDEGPGTEFTGSVSRAVVRPRRGDIVHIDCVIGVGEVAISECDPTFARRNATPCDGVRWSG